VVKQKWNEFLDWFDSWNPHVKVLSILAFIVSVFGVIFFLTVITQGFFMVGLIILSFLGLIYWMVYMGVTDGW
jgi:hypothetical protein